MHSTRWSAEFYAEEIRKQGSVIRIEELPAIHVMADGMSLFCTQINQDNPMKDFSFFLNKSARIKAEKWHFSETIAFSESVHRAASCFNHASECWERSPKAQDSVLVLWSSEARKLIPLEHDRLEAWKSKPFIRGGRLGWVKVRSKVTGDAVLRFCRRLSG